jgi:predicted DNA-binding transcriptional regulator YafY
VRPRGFNLDQYIRKELGYPLSGNEIKLKAWIHKDASQHVLYTKLSDDQEIDYKDNGLIVTATVRETVELKWWLLGLGKRIEVLEPASLRNVMKSTLQEAAKLYR